MTFLAQPSSVTPVALRRGAFARLCIGLWLALQLGITGGLPALDAAVEHPETPVSHIEDASGGDCPQSHGHGDCDLCQLLGGVRALPLTGAAAGAPLAARELPPPESRQVVAHAVFLDGHSSRAPPLG